MLRIGPHNGGSFASLSKTRTHKSHILQLSTQRWRLGNVEFSSFLHMSIFLMGLCLPSCLEGGNLLTNQGWNVGVGTRHIFLNHRSCWSPLTRSPHIFIPHSKPALFLFLLVFWRLFIRFLHLTQMFWIDHNNRGLSACEKVRQLRVSFLHKLITRLLVPTISALLSPGWLRFVEI